MITTTDNIILFFIFSAAVTVYFLRVGRDKARPKREYTGQTEREDKCTIIASLNYCRRADVGWKHDAGELADWLMVPYDFAGNPCQRIGFRIHAERGPRPERTEIDEEAVP